MGQILKIWRAIVVFFKYFTKKRVFRNCVIANSKYLINQRK